ncbi:ferritin-like domain-containing protein [Sulfurimonas marina]|uniref:Ferritin-like domain-containing protein n=1 Tax=Sulfurimonas marina TaxID=2590551 RepID=A0A7M1AX46_9BACT|nr:ferritin-like domain-containing protein [Sulfurimonas marina]QOP40942.1 ferritin-like domain-containing protein [Sulfurimonas marina]
MNFYNELEVILEIKTPTEKLEKFREFYKEFVQQEIDFSSEENPKIFTQPAYEGFCKVVPPQKVPKRSNLTTKEGQINLLHAVAHIEYSAIDLALDAAYRFRGLPRKYYEDWLEVANDEVRHFEMLETLLDELGSSYGEIEVHNSLFEASFKTQTLLERMAVVPRYLEANGLDATPMILEKLKNYPKNEILEKIKSALTIILQEEIDHVKKGDVWFSYACELENEDPSVFFDIIKKYYPRSFLRPDDLNIEARKEAGFSCSELKIMANKEVC